MNPTNGQTPQPGYLDRILGFLFGQGPLSQAAGQQQGPPPVAQNFLQQRSSPLVPDQSQNNNAMQGIVNAYMQQKAQADAAKAVKTKKKKQPVLEEDDD
jgi:hypothetical protein